MTTADVVAPGVLGLKVGELVEVRSAEEIRATLDENGELDGLPFMPEMLAFCGRRLTVHKVAHKSCDNISRTGPAADDRRRPPHRVALRRVGPRRLRERLLPVLEGAVAQARRPRRPGRRRPRTPVIACSSRCWWRRRRRSRSRTASPATPARRPRCCGPRRSRCRARTSASTGEDVTSGNAGVARGRPVLPGRRVQPLPGPQQAVPARAPCASAAACTGASCRVASPVVVRRPSTWTSSPASSSGSSRARRSWRRWTPTC